MPFVATLDLTLFALMLLHVARNLGFGAENYSSEVVRVSTPAKQHLDNFERHPFAA